jgi:hypothetical protein
MDVATIKTINPTAMATIRRLIDCLIIDPGNFLKRWRGRVFEMALPPWTGALDIAWILKSADHHHPSGKAACS